MSQTQPLHWQKHSGWAAEPSSWPGKGHPHPGTGSHPSLHRPGLVGSPLSQSSLPAQWRTFWHFVGIMSCTGSDEPQSWSKASSKTMESGTRWEGGRSGAFFLWEGVSTPNTSLHLPIISPQLCLAWTDGHQILPNYHILLLPPAPTTQQRGESYFCEAISSSPGVLLSQDCICIIKVHFLNEALESHTRTISVLGMALCCQCDISSLGD